MRLVPLAVLALALFSLAPTTGAQTTNPYMTVDAVHVSESAVGVTGVVQGESSQSTRSATFYYSSEARQLWALDACHRSLLLALGKPGQYVAKVGVDTCTVALIAP